MIKATDISIGYPALPSPLLSGISTEISEGECILLCGPNGCGKTTLMKTLSGLLKPLDGTVECTSNPMMVPTRIPKIKGFTLEEFIGTSQLTRFSPSLSIPVSKPRSSSASIPGDSIHTSLELLGISELSGKDISSLSDGQFQKGCIAAALSQNADVVFLDEPTAFLDVEGKIDVLDTLSKVSKEKGISIVFSSHDILSSLPYATRVMGFSREKESSEEKGTSPVPSFHLEDSGKDAPLEKKRKIIDSCFPDYFLNLRIERSAT